MSHFEANKQAFAHCVVVLYEPQDDINIGNAVRACKNFGITDIRLIRPATADPARIAISAPKCGDIIANITHYDTVEEALGDCVQTIALTARRRRAKSLVLEPRSAAIHCMEHARNGRHIALLFGREDSGLPNDVVEYCNFTVTIPTDPDYSSLNLGQAILLMVWELFRVGSEVEIQTIPDVIVQPSSEYPLAHLQQIDRMCAQGEEALHAIGFFKADSTNHIMRSIRGIFQRANLDTREAALWHGIFKEIVSYIRRSR